MDSAMIGKISKAQQYAQALPHRLRTPGVGLGQVPGPPERLHRALDVTEREDFPESERIHRVLASGRTGNSLLGRNEVAVAHFHRSLRSLLADAEISPGA